MAVTEVAQAAALGLAAILVVAAVAKARARTSTVRSFAGLGLPAAPALAAGVPLVEGAIAVGLVVVPALAAWVGVVVLAGFSIVIARAVARGVKVPCACFGAGGAAGDRPVSSVELVRNAGLAALALVASGAGRGSALWPTFLSAAAVAAAVLVGHLALRLWRQRWEPGPDGM